MTLYNYTHADFKIYYHLLVSYLAKDSSVGCSCRTHIRQHSWHCNCIL